MGRKNTEHALNQTYAGNPMMNPISQSSSTMDIVQLNLTTQEETLIGSMAVRSGAGLVKLQGNTTL